MYTYALRARCSAVILVIGDPSVCERCRDLQQQRFDQGRKLRHLCGRQHNRGLVLVEQTSLKILELSLHFCLSPSLSRTGEILEAHRPPRAEIVKYRWKTAAPYTTYNALPMHPSSMPVSIQSHHPDAE